MTPSVGPANRLDVQSVRHLLKRRRWAMLLCAATLLLKLLVPAGYMIDGGHGRIAITVCSGSVPAAATMDMAGMHDGTTGHESSKDHGRTEMPCAFSGLSAAATGAIDPVQVAALIVFILAMGLIADIVPVSPLPAHLRPPLRGPPVYL